MMFATAGSYTLHCLLTSFILFYFISYYFFCFLAHFILTLVSCIYIIDINTRLFLEFSSNLAILLPRRATFAGSATPAFIENEALYPKTEHFQLRKSIARMSLRAFWEAHFLGHHRNLSFGGRLLRVLSFSGAL